MDSNRGNRRFAAAWARRTSRESREDRERRRRVLAGLHGRVLEIGFGVGTNWEYLPPGVAYAGVEPDPYMLERARERAAGLDRRLDLRQGRAEELPFADESFDAVVSTLTLCTVQDPAQALREVRRVLKPGGELRFWEHVRPDGHVLGRLIDAATPFWRRVGGGCNLNRRTAAAIGAAGFDIVECERVSKPPLPMIVGRAVPRDDAPGEQATGGSTSASGTHPEA